MLKTFCLYIHTIRRLKPQQIVRRMMKRLPRVVPKINSSGIKTLPLRLCIASLDLDKEYLSRFDVETLLENKALLLNQTHVIDMTYWREGSASHLWNYNLHYFEYAIPLAQCFRSTGRQAYFEKLREMILMWIRFNPIGKGDAWQPYTISLRFVNWLISFELAGEAYLTDKQFYAETVNSLYAQYRYLLQNKETNLLGNHYLENLKAIVIGSLFFCEDFVYQKYVKKLMDELAEQILTDGMHFELSFMYHKLILEDLIRISLCMQQVGKSEYHRLLSVVSNMINILASAEKGFNRTPLFNDAGDNIAKSTESLLRAAKERFGIMPEFKCDFCAAGYYKFYENNIAVLFDGGRIVPDYVPGHGHCDCLSFELALCGKMFFVNSGTYQYQGDKRAYFRATRAHNTVLIGEHEQSECWAEHRIARRIHCVKVDRKQNTIVGEYRNYVGALHRRNLSIVDGTLRVLDYTETSETTRIRSYLHICDGYKATLVPGGCTIEDCNGEVCKIYCVECQCLLHTEGELTYYAPAFGVLKQATCLEFYWETDENQHGYTAVFQSF